jgi:hypothetical protein
VRSTTFRFHLQRGEPDHPGRCEIPLPERDWQDWVMSGAEGKGPLVVDLSGMIVGSTDELWDQLAQPCGLPPWFGRNLDAWVDTLRGGVSETLDSILMLVIAVQPLGLFAPGNKRGETFTAMCDDSGRVKVERFGPIEDQ